MNFFVAAVEDVSDLWPNIKSGFEARLPFKTACLNNKTRNPVFVQKLPSEFILTTDSRLRSRFPQEQSLFWFREPYATLVLVTCEVKKLNHFLTRCIFVNSFDFVFVILCMCLIIFVRILMSLKQ